MKDKKQDNNAKIQLIFSEVFRNDNDASIAALQTIMALCGYDQPNIRLNNDGDISANANIYNEGRRSVYLDIRKYISEDILTEVEIKRRRKDGGK